MLDVILKLTFAGSDGFGGGIVPLPSEPNSKNNLVVVFMLFGPEMLISAAGAAVPKVVMVCRSTVPDCWATTLEPFESRTAAAATKAVLRTRSSRVLAAS